MNYPTSWNIYPSSSANESDEVMFVEPKNPNCKGLSPYGTFQIKLDNKWKSNVAGDNDLLNKYIEDTRKGYISKEKTKVGSLLAYNLKFYADPGSTTLTVVQHQGEMFLIGITLSKCNPDSNKMLKRMLKSFKFND